MSSRVEDIYITYYYLLTNKASSLSYSGLLHKSVDKIDGVP